ncbi:MAG: HEAT repeat domain-containing protein [Candidatus Aminicenantes bacterium]|nr:HEAT repeat domain-containing protein [Candidatus Aminicenantes bacterium]
MEALLEYFSNLNTSAQVKFLKAGKHEEYLALNKRSKIEFIKTILKRDLSSKTTASAIKSLRELGYNDKFFYRKFLFHIDNSVSNAAKKAINECALKQDTGVMRAVNHFQEGSLKERMEKIGSFFKKTKSLQAELIISLLKSDNQQIRETVVKGISIEHELDDRKLAEAVKSGVVWYVRAALVVILRNRRSDHLFDIIDFLLTDKNVEVRLELIETLAGMDRDKAKQPLERLTADPLIWVRRKAQKALTQI